MESPAHPSLLIVLRLLPLLLCACTSGAGPAPLPETVSDCAAITAPTAREECRYQLIEPLLSDPAALQAALGEIAEPESRDLLLLRLATRHPDRASLLCRQVTTPPAQEKCTQVLGRPHLSTRPRPPR